METEKEKMPCGSPISCFECIHWVGIDGCSHINRMTEPQYEQHLEKLIKKADLPEEG